MRRFQLREQIAQQGNNFLALKHERGDQKLGWTAGYEGGVFFDEPLDGFLVGFLVGSIFALALGIRSHAHTSCVSRVRRLFEKTLP